MKKYKSIKVVSASQSTSTQWMKYRERLNKDIGKGYSDATLEPDLPGYMVCYNNGTENEYWSWSPKDVFEEGYEIIEEKAPFNTTTKFA